MPVRSDPQDGFSKLSRRTADFVSRSADIMIQTNIDGFGTNAIAAMSAYSKVDAFCWVTLDSFGVAITAISGQYYGAGKVDGVRRSVRVCAVLAAVSSP